MGAARFAYSAKQWKPIALVLGKWSRDHKIALEEIGRRYLALPTAEERRRQEQKREQAPGEIYAAVNNLRLVLDEHGWDYRIGGESLSKVLDDFAGGLEQEMEFVADEYPRRPATKEDPARRWLLDELCRYWFDALRRRERITVDRVTAEPRGPLVTFLRSATEPLLGRHPLTANMAKHAVDRYRKAQKLQKRLLSRVGNSDDMEFADELPLPPNKPMKKKKKQASPPRMAKRAA